MNNGKVTIAKEYVFELEDMEQQLYWIRKRTLLDTRKTVEQQLSNTRKDEINNKYILSKKDLKEGYAVYQDDLVTFFQTNKNLLPEVNTSKDFKWTKKYDRKDNYNLKEVETMEIKSGRIKEKVVFEDYKGEFFKVNELHEAFKYKENINNSDFFKILSPEGDFEFVSNNNDWFVKVEIDNKYYHYPSTYVIKMLDKYNEKEENLTQNAIIKEILEDSNKSLNKEKNEAKENINTKDSKLESAESDKLTNPDLKIDKEVNKITAKPEHDLYEFLNPPEDLTNIKEIELDI